MSMAQGTAFGDLLRFHRKAAGLTQEELAESARIAPETISALERGINRAPHRDTVRTIADALNLAAQDRATFLAAARPHALPGQHADIGPIPAPEPAPSEPPVRHMPSGTVTFLFSDIEGSTRLLQQVGGEVYAALLGQHQSLLRAAWSGHGGVEIDTEGDSFFVAFPSAPQAVAAAAEATQALAGHPWPEGEAIRVRMGLHTGVPALAGDNYVGLDVHRAARIAAAGHGGQILLSDATRGLVEHELPDGTTLRDLGEYRLKDLQHAERLYQVVLPGLPADFPPLKTLDRARHNLPVQPTPLLGRAREVSELTALLRRDDVRLVTLTGTGGIGKTRLSIQVAAEVLDDFSDGVWLVRLSRLTDPTLVIPTIAQTLGLKESGAVALADVLRTYLRDRHLLLLLDNFEQVMAAAPQVAKVLEACPRVHVLVAGRVPLHLRGEHEFALRPLALPDAQHHPPPEYLVQYAAVALFIMRAQAVQAEFAVSAASAPTVAAICARLDGLPLAIELAAARVKVLPPPALLKRLEHALPVLTAGVRDADERQQTMRSTIAWSDGLLSPQEQRLFRRLAVFVGGCTLEAAEAVCGAPEGVPPLEIDVLDGLSRLVDHSLVQQREDGDEPRFGMLQVIREFAVEGLDASGEYACLRSAHFDHFLALSEEAEPHLLAREQLMWLDRLEREHDNLRAALTWTLEQHIAEQGVRLAGALWPFWHLHSRFREGHRWLYAQLAQLASGTAGTLPAPVMAPVRGRALLGLGVLAFHLSDLAGLTEALTTCSQLLHDQLASRAAGLARFYLGWAELLLRTNSERVPLALDEARRLGAEARDDYVIGLALLGLGEAALNQADWTRAERLHEDSLALLRSVGERYALGLALTNYSSVLLQRGGAGNLERCVTLNEQALAVASALGSRDVQCVGLTGLGIARYHQGDLQRAGPVLQQSLTLAREIGSRLEVWFALRHVGQAALHAGDTSVASACFTEGLALAQELHNDWAIAVSRQQLGMVAHDRGDDAQAWSLLQESTLVLRAYSAWKYVLLYGLRELAGIAAARGRAHAAARLLTATQHLLEQMGYRIDPARPLLERRFTALREQLGEAVFTAAVEEGQALSLEEAVAEALGETSAPAL